MTLFWADQLAEEIINREKFKYIDRKVPKFSKYVVKTSASISGAIHIGNLCDSIRGDSVVIALADSGKNSELMWVSEDMDPMRKVPKGIPKGYEKYIGAPVSDIPDPFGCHNNYSEHFTSGYFEYIDEFLGSKLEIKSMRQEYKRGSFKPFIKKIMDNVELIKEIQNKYRSSPLPEDWIPWTPICEKCGKIITTKADKYENGKVHYTCSDYKFEKTTGKGCGHEGVNDPLKGDGKLMWKSEWAAQWARWKVVSEGAGKEYMVPMSAWWVNAEICEKVLDFPMPVPIFYEYLTIDGKKMSASVGNVVYPKDWLEIARPEFLRYFYNKRLMKTRDFSWRDLPKLYDEYQRVERVYYNKDDLENVKEKKHLKRLYELSQVKVKKKMPLQLPFRLSSMAVQIFGVDVKRTKEILEKTRHIKSDVDEREMKIELERIKKWVDNFAPKDFKMEIRKKPSKKVLKSLKSDQKKYISEFAKELKKTDDIKALCVSFIKDNKISAKDFFSGIYLVLFGEPRGPRLADFIEVYGKKEVAEILSEVK